DFLLPQFRLQLTFHFSPLIQQSPPCPSSRSCFPSRARAACWRAASPLTTVALAVRLEVPAGPHVFPTTWKASHALPFAVQRRCATPPLQELARVARGAEP